MKNFLEKFLWQAELNPCPSPLEILLLLLCRRRVRPRQWFNRLLRGRNRQHYSAGIVAAARNARMASYRAAQKQSRRTKQRIVSAKLRRKWLRCRRRFRAWRVRQRTRLFRWLLVNLLWLALWILWQLVRLWFFRRSCRGRKKLSPA